MTTPAETDTVRGKGEHAHIAEGLRHLAVPVDTLTPDAANARRHGQRNMDAIKASLARWGQRAPIVVQKTGMVVRAGNGRLEAAKALGWSHIAAVVVDDDSVEAVAFALADNRTAELAEWDTETLATLLDTLPQDAKVDTGFTDADLAAMLKDLTPGADKTPGALAARFMVPPMTILNAREGWWKDRKQSWLAAGVASGSGRDDKLVYHNLQSRAPDYYRQKNDAEARVGHTLSNEEFEAKYLVLSDAEYATGTSIFDPVLCELLYRWFSPLGGVTLDPFAGGSVRGIVGGKLGRRYVGIELRPEQVDANRAQAAKLFGSGAADTANRLAASCAPLDPDNTPTVTPVERHGDIWMKRDDLFCIAGVRGGKVRTCWHLAQNAKGLVTAGSRASPQVNIVAHVAKRLGVPVRVHTPTGEASPEVDAAIAAGAERVTHKKGHNNVIVSHAKKDAAERGWTEIPFGMECDAAITLTRSQVVNLPANARRLVVPVGSGMSLAGILWGLKDTGRKIPVLGVTVGKDPSSVLDKYAPPDWRQRCELVDSGVDYHDAAAVTELHGVALDPIYEAKCIPHVRPEDCLWVVGIRQTATLRAEVPDQIAPEWRVGDSRDADTLAADVTADFILSCPPYGDLEVYSDDPADLSNMDYSAFQHAYREIIRKACERLADNRFACFVVGEIRDKRGHYRDFVGDTVQAFRDAGLQFYNEAILVTPIGNGLMRASPMFNASRKLVKTHQNVLVFVKGDAKLATQACGTVDVTEVLPEADAGEATA